MKRQILLSLIIVSTSCYLFGQHADSLRSGIFTDKRDGQGYKWVKVGSQTWMAENLKFKADSGAVCYDNNLVNCDYYGVLYSWDVAQIVCPEGWSLPSDEQWGILEMELGMDPSEIFVPGMRGSEIAHQAKSRFGWSSTGINSDKYGLSVLPAGFCRKNRYSYFGSTAFFWTLTEHGNTMAPYGAWTRSFHSDDTRIGRHLYSRNNFMSVRCVKIK